MQSPNGFYTSASFQPQTFSWNLFLSPSDGWEKSEGMWELGEAGMERGGEVFVYLCRGEAGQSLAEECPIPSFLGLEIGKNNHQL